MFAYRLRKARRERKWTQTELATRANCHHITVSRIENEQHDPTLSMADSLARALGLELSDMVRREQ